jgi:hypothetical protein
MRCLTAILIALAGFSCVTTPVWSAPLATVTIVDGKARILRGAQFFTLKEGIQVLPSDMIESDERTFLQIEYSDGSVVGLGPVSTALVKAFPNGTGHAGDIFLITGWLKVSGPASAGLFKVGSTGICLQPKNGAFVLHRQGPVTQFFVESGELVPVAADNSGVRGAARKAGEFAEVKADQTLAVSGRPSGAFLAELPRAFADTLPPLIAKFAGSKLEPVLEHPINFATADMLVKMFPLERKQLLRRFSERLKDKEFRIGVEGKLASYPEWDRVLHPEKYRPKENKS